jgi:hypothetical protein
MYDVALRREDLTRLLFDIAFIANGIFESRAIELLQLELRGEGSTVGGDVRGSTRVLLVSRSYRRSTGRPSFFFFFFPHPQHSTQTGTTDTSPKRGQKVGPPTTHTPSKHKTQITKHKTSTDAPHHRCGHAPSATPRARHALSPGRTCSPRGSPDTVPTRRTSCSRHPPSTTAAP